jgi:hypothetical protein
MSAASYSRVFKKMRVTLIRELPDPAVLLERSELKKVSGYEREQILTPQTLCGRAEKFVDVMELCSDLSLFQNVMFLLGHLKPGLARELEAALEESESALNAGASASGASGTGASASGTGASKSSASGGCMLCII